MSLYHDIRHGQKKPHLTFAEFKKQFERQFIDPTFDGLRDQIDKLAQIAYQNNQDGHKAPLTQKAGYEFKNPDYDLSVEWIETRDRLLKAERERKTATSRILIINGSPRNEHSCPSEISKSFRMVNKAKEVITDQGFVVDVLDLSLLTAEYGKQIHPCKGCVSTAMPLCHWPCSCYPNHSLKQDNDWMAEIYEKWVSAHGILIITPVHWYQVPSVFKLMMDRMVCADGGNPDVTSTKGKDPKLARDLELAGWDYPQPLAGRAYATVVHGDASGVDQVKNLLSNWLTDLGLVQAGRSALLGSYIGYNEPYPEGHYALDKNKDFMKELEITTLSLIHQVNHLRSENAFIADKGVKHPLKK